MAILSSFIFQWRSLLRRQAFLQLDATFTAGASRPYNWRRKQLQGVHDLIQKHTDELVGAALKDSRLVRSEVLLELGAVLQTVKTELDNVIRSSKTTTKGSRAEVLGLFRQNQKIKQIQAPAGVILVTPHWAFPFVTTLGTLVSAYAAGDVAALYFPPSVASSVADILSKLLPRYIDQLSFAVLGLSQLSKQHAHLLEVLPSPSVAALKVGKDGSLNFDIPPAIAGALHGPSTVYVHQSALSRPGSSARKTEAKDIATAIVQAKLAFNGESPMAPWIAYFDEEVYDDIARELATAVARIGAGLQTATRNQEAESAKDMVDAILKDGAKALISGPLYILEDDVTKISKRNIPPGRVPFLLVSRVQSPDTAIDRMQAMPRLSAFYLFVKSKKFQTYVTEHVDSAVTVANSIPPSILVHPLSHTTAVQPVLSRDQAIVSASSPAAMIMSGSDMESKMLEAIKNSYIERLDEGPGTRMDFFEQVKLVYRGVQFVTLVSVGLGAWRLYNRFSR
ncbi:ALDH-like protein [Gloeophyllum trabeum ATCC 11539]|uniref:ALDH-like protein n=1 Tax=Gloeophyllum trabeum (strain ATCC 11539 / FP-39264 / Madison 617) TaxID=670483 RepID=S7R9K8_GLOTA|nr:ALDH-like protein [Gloeophyllum trabeum ATCC 11539]EPQ50945.1 ALDH-like protein [Gloeophyllum trabeum ATCC 11539]